ncbi:Fc.00g029600.m01.CDS01 [Cosmosporella sp. VM-42]
MAIEYETTDVLICGCGPTGAMLSGWLGRSDVTNIVIEKEDDITTDPRGIALDDDGIRLLQGLGLYEHVYTDIGTCLPKVRFVAGVHNDLSKKPFLCFDTSSTAGNTGHVGAMSHKQPAMEKHLRSTISGAKSSQLRSGCTMTAISEDSDWVYTTYTDSTGAEKHIRSRFLVGADGKTGFTRKMYMEPKGVKLEWAEKTKYQESWVALNWKITRPTPKTHPSFPLWKLGYSPEQVYDLFFPAEFRFLCNPERPAVCGRFGLWEDRLWRFEFLVSAGEDDAEMSKPEMIQKVVFPYIRHKGSRYGLSEDVQFPADCIDVLRCRPFRFSARSCDKWALGRVILCGDAAHVFPPFGGQGIASGFRDAAALSWRLVIACQSAGMQHEQLLRGWYLERKQQLDKSLAATVRNGDMVNSRNPFAIFVRDWGFWLLQLVPAWKRRLELGPRADGPTIYRYADGMVFMPELGGGVAFAQTYCVELGSGPGNEQVHFTDDVIFGGNKGKLFQIAVLLDNVKQVEPARSALDGLDQICPLLAPQEATFLVRRRSEASSLLDYKAGAARVFRSATAEEFANSSLCTKRPAPRGYKEYDMWRVVKNKAYVIVRQDRFVFAACSTRVEIERAATRLTELL